MMQQRQATSRLISCPKKVQVTLKIHKRVRLSSFKLIIPSDSCLSFNNNTYQKGWVCRMIILKVLMSSSHSLNIRNLKNGVLESSTQDFGACTSTYPIRRSSTPQ